MDNGVGFNETLIGGGRNKPNCLFVNEIKLYEIQILVPFTRQKNFFNYETSYSAFALKTIMAAENWEKI
jgi:hypothetical protein